MTVIRSTALALAGALSLAACPGSDEKLQNALEFCQALSTTWVDKAAACQPADGSALALQLSFLLDCPGLQQAQDAGGFSYERAKAQPCLDAFAAASCAVYERDQGPPPACQEVVVPRVAAGGACHTALDLECIGGFCQFDACNAPGTCRAFLGEGASCSAGGRCGPGLTCSGTTCQVSVPPVIVGAGEACNGPGVECGAGLFCDTDLGAWVCAARRTSGACASDEVCALGYDCVGGACAAERRVGAACLQGQAQCVIGLWCDTTSRCARWNTVGAACGGMPNGELAACLGGWCDPTAVVQTGDPPGLCRAFKALGTTCGAGTGLAGLQCGPGAACLQGTCARNYCGPG